MLKFQRPLARRALSTRRPLRVAMRFIKPCSRLRGIRLGCQVRFMTKFLLSPPLRFPVDYSGYGQTLSIVFIGAHHARSRSGPSDKCDTMLHMNDYDLIAPFYDIEHAQFDEDLPLYQDFAALCMGPLLELACGSGRLLLPLAREGYELTGVDTST